VECREKETRAMAMVIIDKMVKFSLDVIFDIHERTQTDRQTH